MDTKEIKIVPPEGYEIDKENSTFECIKFKPKSLTYEDIAIKLFADKCYCTGLYGGISLTNDGITYPNRSSSEKQLKKLLALNKLMNVAKYLNGDWKPNWKDNSDKYYPYISHLNNKIEVSVANMVCSDAVYFKSRQLVWQAIDILGKETIHLALSTDW